MQDRFEQEPPPLKSIDDEEDADAEEEETESQAQKKPARAAAAVGRFSKAQRACSGSAEIDPVITKKFALEKRGWS